ncbi:hypothetical protein [Yinghuangia soli]|uniref:Uncharacterized protein n=1 Tax=Yinghuangia soli TaxID=2908204 RepID=A0AA41U020_9ACTN|nr:hypothetical protein [Yinghuangia soli]MCF2528106.1 hypothetical protein [Yinghuangia soli]
MTGAPAAPHAEREPWQKTDVPSSDEREPWPRPAPPPRDLRDDRPTGGSWSTAGPVLPGGRTQAPVPGTPASVPAPPLRSGDDRPWPLPLDDADAPQRSAASPARRTAPDPESEPDPFPAAAYTAEAGRQPWEHPDFADGAEQSTRFIRYQGDDGWDEPLRRPPLFRRLIIVAVVFAVLVAAFVVLAFTRGGREDESPPPPTQTPSTTAAGNPSGPAVLPAAAPPGWSRTAAWTVKVAAPSARAATIASTTTAVAVVSPEKKVVILDPADGRSRRTFDLPPGEFHGLRIASVDGKPSVVVHAGTQLAYAPADGSAAPTALDLADPDAMVTYAGDSPLIVARGAVSVVKDGKIAPVTMPAGATAMAADGATVIAAVPVGPWWIVTPGAEPAAITPEPPRPGATIYKMAAAGHNRVAVMWTGPDAATVTVVLYDAGSGKAQITADAPLDEMRKTAWVWGTDGQVAALGALVFDLKAAKASVRPGFGPVIGWGNLLYGQNSSDAQTFQAIDATDPNRAPVPLGTGVPLPWGAPTGSLILILDTTPSTAPTLFALDQVRTASPAPGRST